MSNIDKRKTLLKHYSKFTNAGLPRISPPHISAPRKTIKTFMENGTSKRVVIYK